MSVFEQVFDLPLGSPQSDSEPLLFAPIHSPQPLPVRGLGSRQIVRHFRGLLQIICSKVSLFKIIGVSLETRLQVWKGSACKKQGATAPRTREKVMKYSEQDQELARSTMRNLNKDGLLLITNKGGNSFSINYINFDPKILMSITWALCVLEGVSCKNKDGYNTIQVNGYGFNKCDYLAEQIARHVGTFVGYEYL